MYRTSIYGDAQNNDTTAGIMSGTFVGSCAGGHGYILDVNGIQGCVLGSNIAPGNFIIHPEDNFPAGAQTPAKMVIRGGIDEKNITMTRANCAGVTVTVVTADMDATYTTTVFTEDGVGGTNITWDRGATDTTAATNLTAKINALTGTQAVSATSSTNVISIKPDIRVAAIDVTTSGATCAAIASNTDAPVSIFTGSGALAVSGNTAASKQYALFQPTVGLTFSPATSQIVFGTLGGFRGNNADGEVKVGIQANTAGLILNSLSPVSGFPSIGQSSGNLQLRCTAASCTHFLLDNSGNATAVVSAGNYTNTRSTAYLAGDGSNSTATLATTGLSGTVTSGLHYNLELLVMFNDSVAAEGIQLDFGGGAATMTDYRIECIIGESGQVAQDTVTEISGTSGVPSGTVSKAALVGTGAAFIHCFGALTPSSSNTFIPRYAQNTHASGTATIRRGSYLRLDNLP